MGFGRKWIGAVLVVGMTIGLDAVAHAQGWVDPNIWNIDQTNEYWQPPELARNLRCAAMFDVVTDKYFKSPEGPSPKWRGRIGYGYVGWGEARLTPEDERERDAYNAVGRVFAERAWALAEQGEDGPVRSYADARNNAVANGQRFLKAGKLWDALNSPLARCMEEPAARGIAEQLRARLAAPTPDNRKPASPRLKAEWMPSPMFGYLYQANSYRYLVCSALAHAIGELRFGHIPIPEDGPLTANWDKASGIPGLSPADAALRRLYAKASFDTFDAGKVFVRSKAYKETASYRVSHTIARGELLEKLPDQALLEEAMKEPNLRCAELPSMAPIFGGGVRAAAGGGTAGTSGAGAIAADDVIPVSEIPGWPGRDAGYMRRAASFRPLFCGALLYRIYNNNASERAWFAPPSDVQAAWPGQFRTPADPYDPSEQGERDAVKRAVYALYLSAQIDGTARKTANNPRSVFAENFEDLHIGAIGLVSERHAVMSFNEPSVRCGELPEIQPVLQAVLRRLARLDKGELRLR
ncbi:hypothetical protein P6144_02080 [Sphingomonas sp. HITSZ_GF]|uniref:hypothetical protein n=1 Tax=Sphingomonas sp. HITSZ_GF TaxID=3037247 RepID=UPI00240E1468|nr:hypothetical protein [Sphingomonas sp. HITSZ_GF]MDG2532421.1 hypothetical protein [Sphingomonas sp. HITSZ_GF]